MKDFIGRLCVALISLSACSYCNELGLKHQGAALEDGVIAAEQDKNKTGSNGNNLF